MKSLYRCLASRRGLLFAFTALLVLVFLWAASRARLQEDIAAMLPDDQSAAARDFQWLRRMPSARTVIIVLKRSEEASPAELEAAADGVAAALGPPWFSSVMAGPPRITAAAEEWLRRTPSGFSEREAEALEPLARADEVRSRLSALKDRLAGTESWVLEDMFRRDPLGVYGRAAERLRSAALVPTARPDRFVSGDGREMLLAADTPVAVTDYRRSRELAAAARAALDRLPPGISGDFVSGHSYTVANAEAIRKDLALVIGISAAAVLLIYGFFLRTWRALFVFMVPVSVLAVAAGATAMSYPFVFAVTLGFGGVLLGMADEYAMHVFFALRRGGAPPETILSGIARPVIAGGLATAAAFGVMLFSRLPGQRQLAFFSVVGIVFSLLLSLVVLPHLVPPAPPAESRWTRWRPRPAGKRAVIWAWLALMGWSAWQASGIAFSGDLKAMSLVPAELSAVEEAIGRVWGGVRGRAVAFVEGKDLEQALAANDRLYDFLAERLGAESMVSLAPALPSYGRQEENRRRWRRFWDGTKGAAVLENLKSQSVALGFTPAAFDPFGEALGAEAERIGIEDVKRLGLETVVDSLVAPGDGGVRIMTLLPDTPETAALFDGPARPRGAHLVSQALFRRRVSRALAGEFTYYLAATFALVLILTSAVLRRPKQVLLALVPVATGLLFMLGVMAAAGIEFNLFNIVATVLIIGLCVDYGIFMVCHLSGGAGHQADRSVLVSGLTTIAGFGVLILARHPALHSIGLTVILGFGAAVPAALAVIPALAGDWGLN